MIYSLIPAKVNSSRLPGKNTFKFLLRGKPLIAYTIEAVKNAGMYSYVYTDEKNVINTYGAMIIPRPKNTTGNKATMKLNVENIVRDMGLNSEDIILLTYLTCPFRTAEHIKKALELFKTTKANSLQSVTPVDYRPYGLMRQDKNCNYKFKCLQPQQDYYQQQNTPTLFKANGAIYIFKVSELKNLNKQMFNPETIGYILDPIEGLDIDTKLDFMIAEKILEKKQNECLVSAMSSERVSKAKFSATGCGLYFQRSKTNWP